ncbi:hypothetical protein [Streptomyces sp. NPDC102264]|uniref:hypothetical protein n=1 Tax=Streptomyces sp. NPDC102264 TaxID=3366149 RepID=UPI0037FEAB01
MTGLCGTGSEDVIVDDVLVPDYRTIDAVEVSEGEKAAERVGRSDTLYRLPFWAMSPLGITAPVIGTAEGALAAHLDFQRDRVTAMPRAAVRSPSRTVQPSGATKPIAPGGQWPRSAHRVPAGVSEDLVATSLRPPQQLPRPGTGGLSMPLSATAVRAGGSPTTPSVARGK